MPKRVPLAWLQLTHEKLRLAAAVAGIAFAVVLMFMQLGFKQALATASSLVQSSLRGDIMLTSRQYDYLVFSKQFSRRRLVQALAFDGVESAWPVYVGIAQWKNPENLRERSILAIGCDPEGRAINLSADVDPSRLRLPDLALFDSLSRPEYGPIAKMVSEKGSVRTEVNGRSVQVIGLFQLGTSFGVNGTVIASDLNFLRLFPGHPQNLVELGVIRLKPGFDARVVRDALQRGLPPDVNVLTHDAFVQQERDYWDLHTGIGYIFTMGVLMGFSVGAVIVYQILYTDVNDHMPEYATLKAMGHGNSYLASIVLKESLLLSIFGFLPGLAIAKGLYVLTQRATLLPLDMSLELMVTVLLLTVVMCGGSALLAIRKLAQADPADIF
jgi:putative ABC transport system permease protein